MLRAINGHTRVLRLLLSDPSIDVNATNNSSRTALIVSKHIKGTEALRASLPLICEFDTLQNR
ncbi:hypothetical protein TVAG_213410 [Trichomonas vaginalis G3]|uniref:Ankyrin repeat protein n=1 Tax=Trichomonas vaginalis (strain ATCC PRA-98 / G3) TaxID=412133 RepID=A2EEW5_TRIV3|nr:hypothetical protein TVAG_213410 [Trichomonas vaginalis G3]|eukprot:XP_001321054.1 hypothetical protein [Trichomonas vaginalis G3]